MHPSYLLKKKILIVSNDAGGAEIISHYIKNFKLKCRYFLKGPAIKIFQKKIPYLKLIKNIKIKDYDLVITGTSLNNNLEYNIIKLSKENKIKVISFLDHWVNYISRFKRRNKICLPDEIIVGDKDAKIIALKVFKKTKITFCKNYYLESFRENKNLRKKSQNILYVSSNIDSIKKKKITDKKILAKIIDKLIKNKFGKIQKLIIRKHPSENFKKFNYLKLLKCKFEIQYDKNLYLNDSLKKTNFIIGMNSMALVAAKINGLKTINLYIDKKTNTLPLKYIDRNIKIYK